LNDTAKVRTNVPVSGIIVKSRKYNLAREWVIILFPREWVIILFH